MRSTRRGTSLTGTAGAARDQQDRRRSASASTPTSASRRRASTSTTSASCAAPTSAPWATGCRSAATRRTRGSAAGTINFNQCATWNFDGDRLFSGGNVNAHADLRQQLGDRRRLQLQRRSNSTTAPRAAARASTRAVSGRSGTTLNTDNRRAAVSSIFHRRRQQRRRDDVRRRQPERHLPPVAGAHHQPRLPRLEKHRRRAVGRQPSPNGGTHYVFGELDQTDGRDDRCG